MLSYVWTGLLILSCVSACLLGRTNELAQAVTDGAGDAVSLCITMVAIIGLWSGVMELMEQSGMAERIAALLKPLLHRLFPSADAKALQYISANVTANLLGLSNAATPFGLQAAERMYRTRGDSDDLLRFLVLNTTSMQLIPTTVAAVRSTLGAATPFDIMPAVWGASAVSVLTGLAVAYLFSALTKKGKPDD